MLEIVYQPQEKFKVKPVTRCSSSMPGTAYMYVLCSTRSSFTLSHSFLDTIVSVQLKTTSAEFSLMSGRVALHRSIIRELL